MKKEKQENLQSKKELLRRSVEESLILRLKESIEALGFDPKKAKDEIARAAKQIAKKLTKNSKKKKQGLHKIIRPQIKGEDRFDVFGLHDSVDGHKAKNVNTGFTADEDGSQTQATIKRVVRTGNRNIKVDPLTLAERTANGKTKTDEQSFDEQPGFVS